MRSVCPSGRAAARRNAVIPATNGRPESDGATPKSRHSRLSGIRRRDAPLSVIPGRHLRRESRAGISSNVKDAPSPSFRCFFCEEHPKTESRRIRRDLVKESFRKRSRGVTKRAGQRPAPVRTELTLIARATPSLSRPGWAARARRAAPPPFGPLGCAWPLRAPVAGRASCHTA